MKVKKNAVLFLLLIVLLSFPIIFASEQDLNGYISVVAIIELIGAIYDYQSVPILLSVSEMKSSWLSFS